ncbi:HAMP domain-containing sensor histidine kinase [Mycobacterium sp. ACS4331]|uniref:sensor histidine kinase n=1 Tax=Mycobacterium sp. ACS4331 TaxID=1834121 RepID=UPI0007FE9263|nr:HAMP domain-containing sensor histidine kinase [Mycobacterium sp. ACS4331]OBF12511.1 two-component sensor histidine kinase [Mycobacterium sp. ACS4331]
MSSSPPPDARRPRWRTPSAWSLQSRLVIGQVLLLALVCIGIGGATELALRQYLITQLDQNLTDASHRSALMAGLPPPRPRPGDLRPIRMPGPGPDFLDAPGQPVGLIALVENSRGVEAGVLTRDGERGALSDTAIGQVLDVPPRRPPVTVDLDGLGGYRLVATHSRTGDIVVTGLPMDDVNETMLRVLLIMVVVAGTALVTATILGVVITRRSLAPLNRVAATARQVANLPLDRGEVELPVRVPEPDANPHTEVGQMGSALNRMLDHISTALSTRQASETRVRQFVADASHELRTPLTAIRGYTELAQRLRDQVPDEVAHAMGRVASEAERMTNLVEDLLLLARLDSGRPLDREEVDLSQLAVDTVADAHIAGPDHEWNLDLPDEPVVVIGDHARLHQVLANLLANARVHTPAGTTVVVSLSASPDGHAEIRVSDDGPGIPVELQSEVFERFARGDSSRSRNGGSTGLGLAIVWAVVKAHDGQITVDSRPGNTVFTLRLPLTAGT